MKRIAVCGCSWSALSPIPEYKGTHWSESIAKKLNVGLINLAAGGVSNNSIRLQIDKAIEFKPNLVIISPTYFDRIEYPVKGRAYDPAAGLKNLDKQGRDSLTSMRSTTLSTLVHDHKVDFAISYFKHMYIPFWKRQLDRWVLRDGINQLKMSNIPFLIQPQLLWDDDAEAEQFFLGIASKENFIYKPESIFYNIWETAKEFDPGYHTTPRTQEEFAIRLQNLINSSNINL